MEAMVTSREDGETQTHIGLTVCEGPGRMRLVLTRPYHEAGRIVEIPREDIESVEAVENTVLGRVPAPLGDR